MTESALIQQLGKAIRDVAEDCWCAVWLVRTEDILPDFCRRAIETGQPQRWGLGMVTPAKARELTDLAERAGAWADLHPQEDFYVPHQPSPLPPGTEEEGKHE